MMIEDGHDLRTQAPRIYQALRGRIVMGQLKPLTKLKISILAADYAVSPGAVREALSQLATDGLAQARDQRGFRVAPISVAELVDLTETRIQIESLALAQAIERGDDAWEALVRSTHAAMEAHPPQPGDLVGARLHADFHAALAAGCGSPTLIRIRNGLYDHAERYRFLSMQQTAKQRPVADEHAAIAEATLARRKDKAIAALVDHIRFTTALVRDSIAQDRG